MRKYDSYKDSGLEWIGEIPSHWDITKLKFIGNIICGGTPSTSNEEYWTGDIPWIQSGKVQNNIVLPNVVDKKITSNALVESSTKLVKEDSILVAITGATCSNIGYLTFETAVNQSIVAVEPINFNSVLLFNVLKSQKEQILYHQSGGAQGGVTKGDVMNIYIPLPTVQEQTAIANYLDQKTTQIDDLIAKKERLIQLLEEERTAIINQAVTKGLDPSVPMKDSGIEWLGEIPQHWKYSSLKWYSKIYSGGTPSKDIDEYWINGTIPWLNSGCVNQWDITEVSEYITEEAFNKSSAKWIPPKSLVIALAGQGKTKGMVAQVQFETTCNQSLGVIVPNEKIYNRFLQYWLKNNYLNIRSLGGGDKRDGLNLVMIGGIPIPIPLLNEQVLIANFLDNKNFEFDTFIQKSQQEIELLKEYKTALISEVVTGKVDVRNEKLN